MFIIIPSGFSELKIFYSAMAVYLYDYIVYIEGATQYWSIEDEVATLVVTKYDVIVISDDEEAAERPPRRLAALKCNALNKALFEALDAYDEEL